MKTLHYLAYFGIHFPVYRKKILGGGVNVTGSNQT